MRFISTGDIDVTAIFSSPRRRLDSTSRRQNRYKSIVCQEDAYLLELVRYIHLNLLRAGLVKDMRELNQSPWSGHSAVMGNVKREWQDTDYVHSFFGKGHETKRRYQEFVGKGIDKGKRPELTGGGLIRSAGGWFEVLALRRSGDRQASDQRILGDGEFVQQLLGEMDEMGSRNLRLPHEKMSLELLAARVCEVHEVRSGELLSGSRRREIIEARRIMSWLSVKELGYSGAEVARYLGVTNSCVTRWPSARFFFSVYHLIHTPSPKSGAAYRLSQLTARTPSHMMAL
jgi:putative transposase